MKYTEYETMILREDGMHIPKSGENRDYVGFLAWVEEGNAPDVPLPAPVPTFDDRKALLLAAVDTHLNAAAQAKGYDSILAASLRAALPSSVFHAEGVAFGTWMDAVYAKCYEVLAQVLAGEIEEPTRDELLAMLPELQLPE